MLNLYLKNQIFRKICFIGLQFDFLYVLKFEGVMWGVCLYLDFKMWGECDDLFKFYSVSVLSVDFDVMLMRNQCKCDFFWFIYGVI